MKHVAGSKEDRGTVKPGPASNAHGSKEPTKREKMLADQNIKRWHANMARGSLLIAETQIRRLRRFCEIATTTPREFAKMAEEDWRKAADLISDCVTWMEAKGYSPGYTDEVRKSAVSWLDHFRLAIQRKIKVRWARSTPTLKNERVPDADEMSEVYGHSSLRTGAMIAPVSQSGVRLQVMGNHNGTEGLRIGDLSGMKIRNERVEYSKGEPCAVLIRAELSKGGHRYFSYIGRFAVDMLLKYFDDRARRGEKLGYDSPVMAPYPSHQNRRGPNSNKAFLTTNQISNQIRCAIRGTFGKGRKLRPYAMRALFDTQLLTAESRSLLAHDFRVFWMGHAGSMESRYTTNKGVLPEELLTEMRAAYRRSEHLLEPAGAPTQEDRRDRGEQAPWGSPTQEDRRDKDVESPAGAPTQEDRRDRGEQAPWGSPIQEDRRVTSDAAAPRQRAVLAGEAAGMINRGWVMVDRLPNDMIVLAWGGGRQ